MTATTATLTRRVASAAADDDDADDEDERRRRRKTMRKMVRTMSLLSALSLQVPLPRVFGAASAAAGGPGVCAGGCSGDLDGCWMLALLTW